DHRHARTETRAQRDQFVDLGIRAQRDHFEALRMAADHIQRGGADRSGGAEQSDTAWRSHSPSHIFATRNTGSAANRLSSRSSTPPWPGISWLESLMPEWRLSRLSNKSPATEINPVIRVRPISSG